MAKVILPSYRLKRPIAPLIDACLQGTAAPSNFEDYVEYWHTHETIGMCSFLGMSDWAYSLMLKHGECNIIEEVLSCKRLGADFDEVWTSHKVPALLELCKEIKTAKAELHNQISLSNADTFEKLNVLGALIAQKNEVSGLTQDIGYLYLDDGEFYRCVAGFIGDESPLVDSNGLRLLIGDTIVYPGSEWERMVILGSRGTPMLHQEDILSRGGVKKSTCWELEMRAADCAAFSVTHESCLERFQKLQQTNAPQMGGMSLG